MSASRGGGAGRVQAVRPQLPAGPAAGRARRAVRQLYHASWDHHSNLDAELALQLPAWPTSRWPR